MAEMKTCSSVRNARRRGGVLVEAGLLLVVLLLGAWLAVDLMARSRQRQRCDDLVADLRSFAAAFQKPASVAALASDAKTDGLPAAVVEALKATNWDKASPFGGRYEWLPPTPAPTPVSAPHPTAVAAPAPIVMAAPAASVPDAVDLATKIANAPAMPAAAVAPDGNASPTPAPTVNPTATAMATATAATTPPPPAAPTPAPPVGNGAIIVTAFFPQAPLALSRADLLRIDAQLDDGNLATGRFRTGFNGWPVYTLEPAN